VPALHRGLDGPWVHGAAGRPRGPHAVSRPPGRARLAAGDRPAHVVPISRPEPADRAPPGRPRAAVLAPDPRPGIDHRPPARRAAQPGERDGAVGRPRPLPGGDEPFPDPDPIGRTGYR